MSDAQQPDDAENTYGEAVSASSGARPKPGDIVIDDDLKMAPEPLVGDDASTALEEDEPEGTIPPNPLWALKDRRHTQWHLLPSHERHERLRAVLGTGDETLYVIDDGRTHAMIGRPIGATAAGASYCLLGRVTRQRFEALSSGEAALADAFADAHELAICGIAVEESVASSNIFDVSLYGSADEIPSEYLPGSPFHNLAQDLEITAY